MEQSFVHLHLHSEYSLANGIARIKPLVKAAARLGMPAVAITDQSNLFAMVKFYRAAIAAGIKPIIGVDVWVESESERTTHTRLVLLCQNRRGYLNLTQLISRSYQEGQQSGIPSIQKSWLAGATDGLIALSGAAYGDIGCELLAGHSARARQLLDDWQGLFPERFYLEIQRTGRGSEEEYIHSVIELAIAADVPLVASNDVHFLKSSDFEAHEARVCINEGRVLSDSRRQRQFTDQQYLKSTEEMAELFKDIPSALVNTLEIAKRCNFSLVLGQNALPDFPVPAGKTTEGFLKEEAEKGLQIKLDRLNHPQDPKGSRNREQYQQRLKLELDVINGMGFPGYFLIVADFIRWAKDNGVPVGPGRGSGAGSLVAYVLGITDLDPIEYDLLFERFLNPERVSLPDFDIDFCMEGRDRVIDYVGQRYGRDRVSQIITYGSMAARAVVRDVGRVLGFPYGFVDQIAKLIPFEIGVTLDKALDDEEQLRERYQNEDDVRTLIDLAKSLEGLARNAGKHAGGVVIAPSALTDFTPLYCEAGATTTVTQFDKDDVEAVGLVKFDFLGLRTLTIINKALIVINEQRINNGDEAIDISTIPLDDIKTFELLKRCSTTAVFQLESRGMKDLIKRLVPECFDEIIALVALFRPGPLQSGMVDDFINRKHGARVDYAHPELVPILQSTYGVILYQEQVMQIAQVLSGYTLGAADLLRRAMGKKKPEEMAKQREIFVSGAIGRGIKESVATYIFDLMEKFAGYGFNKSHSAAYALIAYQTAWLKAHYPAAFMAAALSADMDNTDKVVTLINECRDISLTVLPPNVNQCVHHFSVKDDKTILYGLGAIKGVGAAAIEGLVENRKEQGVFSDLFEFCCRVDLRKVNRRVIEALIRSGSMDDLGPNRATLFASINPALQVAEQHLRDKSSGQDDLFGGIKPVAAVAGSVAMDEAENIPGAVNAGPTKKNIYQLVTDWPESQRLTGEKETLGLYLTGHPINRYEDELSSFITSKLVDLKPTQDRAITVAGLVIAIRVMNNRRGDRMAFITLDDRTGRLELGVFTDVYQRYRDLLIKDKLLVVQGTVTVDDYTGGVRMSADKIYDIEHAREIYAKRLVINLNEKFRENDMIESLQKTLIPFREGGCPVWVEYKSDNASARLALDQKWHVHPTDELLYRLGKLAGDDQVRYEY